MKLWQNEEVVEALKDILKEDYPYLKYDEEESKRLSTPPAEVLSEQCHDVLHVKVVDVNANRDFADIGNICTKLKESTGIHFFLASVVNTPNWENEWTKFNIRKW